MKGSFVFILTVMVVGLQSPLTSAAENDRYFLEKVAPIFERHCLHCHHDDSAKAGFSLENASSAAAGGDSGPAWVAGNPNQSELLQLVSGEKPAMPKNSPALRPDQVETLKQWIAAGAVWPAQIKLQDRRFEGQTWWSFQPLVQPAVPGEISSKGLIRNPIDSFILARLNALHLDQSPEASRRTLIRRLSFDLLGLPPTPEIIVAFENDVSPDAYEKVVDRMLASPQYGERWARHWLDLVHYGDTHGYDKDKLRPNAWPYRDYVIRSLNQDKNYSQFVQEQIAGDILFPGTSDGIEALGFIAAGPWDFIGHAEVPETKIDGKIARHLDRDDMVANTMGTFNSLTVHCAQCHNHKFDPISQEDYYRLQSVFAALDRAEKMYDPDPAVTIRREELSAQKKTLEKRLAELRELTIKQGGQELVQLELKIASQEKVGKSPLSSQFGYHSQIASRNDQTKWVQVDLGQETQLQMIEVVGCHDDFNNIGAGFGFPVRFRIEVSNDAEFQSNVKVLADHTSQDFPNPGIVPQRFSATGTSGRYIRVTATKLAPRMNDYIFALAELQAFNVMGTNVAAGKTVRGVDSIEAVPRWQQSNLVDGYYVGAPSATQRSLEELYEQRNQLIRTKVDTAIQEEQTAVVLAISKNNQSLAQLPAPRLVYAGTVHHGTGSFSGTGSQGGKPRPIHLLHRGDVNQPKHLVLPGALSTIRELNADFESAAEGSEGLRRSMLAQWLTDSRHPLTWRSIVNRIWQHHFGRGLVETANDFGRMGSRPSHPELLDWLAIEFRDGGQSLKALHRLIVTSATYRQVSYRDNAKLEEQIDVENRLLWRMSPRKLEAEALRDAVLAISGKLDASMTGPGFQDFILEKPEHSPHYEYRLFDPEDVRSHRRSIYRFIVRSQQQPFMTTLDCADPSQRVDRRNESLSALQALALLNNGVMVTMSRHFAARIRNFPGELQAKIALAFVEALGRHPADDELSQLTSYAELHGLDNLARLIWNLNEFAFID